MLPGQQRRELDRRRDVERSGRADPLDHQREQQRGRRVDQAVTWVRGHGWSQLYCRPVGEWAAALEQEGFAVQVLTSFDGPPFANTFVVGRLPA